MEKNCDKSGVKLLLSMKEDGNITGEFDFKDLDIDEACIINDEVNDLLGDQDVYEITENEFNKNCSEMDEMINDIIKTREKLKLGKLKEKIKTKEDLLSFYNINSKNNNAIPPEGASLSTHHLENLKIDHDSLKNKEFDAIKNRILSQNSLLKEKENKTKQYYKPDNNSTIFVTSASGSANSLINQDDELTIEIKNAESKCDDLLDDIDELIQMGEQLEKEIEMQKNKP
jgi:hypothetical protein